MQNARPDTQQYEHLLRAAIPLIDERAPVEFAQGAIARGAEPSVNV